MRREIQHPSAACGLPRLRLSWFGSLPENTMNASAVELFAHAAERARDVAVMMDAARALTVLGRARLASDASPAESPDTTQVVSLYQTAERLGQHVRQMSSEARSLLLTAKQMLEAEPANASQLPPDFSEVCRMMDEAMDRAVEAIERLDEMRQAATPLLAGAGATPEVRLTVDELIARLRHGDLR
jgi:signal transduction histidine kinase